jgi:hypothetical protein
VIFDDFAFRVICPVPIEDGKSVRRCLIVLSTAVDHGSICSGGGDREVDLNYSLQVTVHGSAVAATRRDTDL